MKRILSGVLLLCLLLSGCAGVATPAQTQYTATFLSLFDTVTTIVGRAESEEAFRAITQEIHDELLEYHQLFDIYQEYPGMNNLKTVNDRAGVEPVVVDGRILALLQDCKTYYEQTNGMVNVAMGSVLRLWHEARTDSLNAPAHAWLPKPADLQAAADHMDLSCVELDEAASTVYIRDPQVRLDVGAIAKGWSVQQVGQNAPAGLLISVGGNVFATGPKVSDGTPWVVGIQDPDGEGNLHTVYVSGGSVVTSGDYQRNFAVDGQL